VISLSRKEVKCLELCASGLKDREIAAALEVTISTVRFHANNFMKKLGARQRAHAVFLAMESGLLRAEDVQPIPEERIRLS
jgi:LuxR family transcriptional regulator